tara:strand:+ start:189 stop:503 length:315 start_codon:yes stop_codon:yes gene_type:complete
VEIKTRKSFNDLITSLTEEILDEEELDEITTTGDIEGYNTPFAFTGKKGKKKKKKISTNSTGYKVVKEALDEKDLKQIRKVIKDVVGDIFRDIWLKRNSWKKAS